MRRSFSVQRSPMPASTMKTRSPARMTRERAARRIRLSSPGGAGWDQIAEGIPREFKDKDVITCYLGSNAATPTAAIEALTAAVKAGNPRLPFIRMVHILLQGPVPYVEEGLQDRIITYSIFSAGDVRKAANEGNAYYLSCL